MILLHNLQHRIHSRDPMVFGRAQTQHGPWIVNCILLRDGEYYEVNNA